MTTDQFKILHSEIMMYFQCIEYDLKRIYSGMSSEDFDDEMDMLEMSNFGNTLRKLKQLDESDGDPWLSEADYEQLDCSYLYKRFFSPNAESGEKPIQEGR